MAISAEIVAELAAVACKNRHPERWVGPRSKGVHPDSACLKCRELARVATAVSPTGVIAPMPNKPKTPMHSFRISDEDWEAAKAKAAERGENWSEELRKFARRYAKSKR